MSSSNPPSRGPGLGVVILVSMITSAAVSAGVVLALVEGWRLVPDEEVPALDGMSADAARGMLEGRGLRFVLRGERHDDEVEEGAIVEQQPGAGSLVPRGSEVTVIVSEGPDRVEVPDVVGLSLAPARARLANAGLRVSSSVTEGGEGAPGTVSSTSPSGAARVARDTEVFLTVVAERRLIAVPDLAGVSSRVARETLTQAGLTVGEITHGFDDVRPPYIVLRQTPAAATQVEPGTAVALVINEE